MSSIKRFPLEETIKDNHSLLGVGEKQNTRRFEIADLAEYLRKHEGFADLGISLDYTFVADPGANPVEGTVWIAGNNANYNIATPENTTPVGLTLMLTDIDALGRQDSPLLSQLTEGAIIKIGAPPHGVQYRLYRLGSDHFNTTGNIITLTLDPIPMGDSQTSTDVTLLIGESIDIVPIAGITSETGPQGFQGRGITDIDPDAPVVGTNTNIDIVVTNPADGTSETFPIVIPPGANGRGIQNITATGGVVLGEDTELTILYTNGDTAGPFTIKAGAKGDKGDSISVENLDNGNVLGQDTTFDLVTRNAAGTLVSSSSVVIKSGVQGAQGLGYVALFKAFDKVPTPTVEAPAVVTFNLTTGFSGTLEGWTENPDMHTISTQSLYEIRQRINPNVGFDAGGNTTLTQASWGEPFVAGDQGPQGVRGYDIRIKEQEQVTVDGDGNPFKGTRITFESYNADTGTAIAGLDTDIYVAEGNDISVANAGLNADGDAVFNVIVRDNTGAQLSSTQIVIPKGEKGDRGNVLVRFYGVFAFADTPTDTISATLDADGVLSSTLPADWYSAIPASYDADVDNLWQADYLWNPEDGAVGPLTIPTYKVTGPAGTMSAEDGATQIGASVNGAEILIQLGRNNSPLTNPGNSMQVAIENDEVPHDSLIQLEAEGGRLIFNVDGIEDQLAVKLEASDIANLALQSEVDALEIEIEQKVVNIDEIANAQGFGQGIMVERNSFVYYPPTFDLFYNVSGGVIEVWNDTNPHDNSPVMWHQVGRDVEFGNSGGQVDPIAQGGDDNPWPKFKLPPDTVYEEAGKGLSELDSYTIAGGMLTLVDQAGASETFVGGGTAATFRTWTTTAHDYVVGDIVVFEGDHFLCIAAHTSTNANPFVRPEEWAAMSSDGFDIDSLAALRLLNSSMALRSNVFPGDIANVINDPDPANDGLYFVLTSDNENRTAGTTVLSIDSLGTGDDDRFDGTITTATQVASGVTVTHVAAILDAITNHTHTIILPSANPTVPFEVGDTISDSATGVLFTIIQVIPTATTTEVVLEGDQTATFAVGDPIFRSNTPTQAGTVWTLPAPGADAYTQSNALNDEMAARKLLSEEVQANATAIAAFQADLVSIAAYQPQGTYLSGGVTPSFADDQVDRSGSATGTGYANTGELRVYHDGRFEVLTYLMMPNVGNAPDPAYVDAFEEVFRLEDIIGFSFVSGAYNIAGFPHVMNATLETKYDNGHGQGLKAYFLNGIYQGRVEVRFQGQLSAAQNNDRTFITLHQDNTILYDNYTAYQIYPTNAFWHNVRVADPEQIFLLKEGVFLLHELSDAASEANVGRYLTVAQNLNFVDTFNYPAGTNLSQNLAFFLSRPHNGDITISALPAGLTATVNGNEIDLDYTGTVPAGSFTATYATTGIEAVDLPVSPTQTINILHDITVTSNDVGYVRGTGTFDYLEFTGSAELLVFLDALGFDTTIGSYTDIVFGHAITFTLDGHTFTLPDTAEYDYDTAQNRFVFDHASVTNRPAADLADGTLTTVAHDFNDTDVNTIRSGDGIEFTVNGTDLSIASPSRTVISDNLIEGESFTIPGNNWVIVPNTVRYYLFYNHHGGPITIGPAPAGGWTLEEVAEQIISETALILINEDHLDLYPRAADPMDTDYARPFDVVHGSTWYFEHNLWLYEGDADITVSSDALTYSTRPNDTSADWVRLHNIAWNRHITYYESDLVGYGSPMVIYRATSHITGNSPAGANFATLNPETQAASVTNPQWEVFSLGNSGNNTFTGDNTFTGTNIFSGTGNRFLDSLEIREGNNDADANPLLTLNRRSNDPAAADDIGLIEFKGSEEMTAGDVKDDFNYAVIGGEIVAPDVRTGGIYFKVADDNEATDSSAGNHLSILGKTGGGATATFATDVDIVGQNLDINGALDATGATLTGVSETTGSDTLVDGATELRSVVIKNGDTESTFNILNPATNTILDNLEGVATDFTYPIPGTTNVVDFDTLDAGGGGATPGTWYYRANTSAGARLDPDPTSWADLEVAPGAANDDLVTIVVDAETADDAALTAMLGEIDAGITITGNVITTDLSTVDAGLLYVSDGTTDNAAVLRVYTSGTGDFDVRFVIEEVVSFVGTPPVDGTLRISSDFQTHTGTINVPTLNSDLNVTGAATFANGELIRDYPATFTDAFTINRGDYWEVDNKIYRRDGGDTPIQTPSALTNNIPVDTGVGSDWINITREVLVANGPGLGLVTGDPVDGVTTFTLSSDTVLNRADVTVPTIQDQILKTGEVNSIVNFLGSAIANNSNFTVNYDADETPLDGSISFVDAAGIETTVWTEVDRLRVNSSDVDASTFFNTFTQPGGQDILITYRNPDASIDTTNWALFRTSAAVAAITNALQLSVELVEVGEYGGAIQNELATVYVRNGAFLPDNVLAYAASVVGSATEFDLTGEIVFDLEQTGISTVTTGSNSNTQITSDGVPGATTSTLHHQSPNSMAYLALQFNSVFTLTGGVTSDNSAALVNGVVGDFVYIQYTSTWDGVTGVVFVDRVRTTEGPDAATEADERLGFTTTRRYVGTGTVTEFIFNPGTAVTSTIVPQV